MTTLPEKLLAISASLSEADIPHAFGGAIALAYCTEEPRATQDLDINIFAEHDHSAVALASLPREVVLTAKNHQELRDIGQTRGWWDHTPIDLFLKTHPFHTIASHRVRLVPFADRTIPVLDGTTLAVFKVISNRTKDWADLEAMAEAGQLDAPAVSAIVTELLGNDDGRLARLSAIARDSHT